MRGTKGFWAVIALLALFCVGCSYLLNRTVGGAVSGLGRATSERAEQAAYEKAAPKEKLPAPKATLPAPASPGWGQFMALQAQVAFSYSFSAGGLWLGQVGYEPGEWTRFAIVEPGDETPVVLERAFLRREEDGNEWWRISWSEDEESFVYEALLSPSEGRLVRLRARDAEGNEGEVPVTGQALYVPPAEIAEASIKGATAATEDVITPAGTFTADHVVFLAATAEGSVEWWLTDQVPGGVVKYLLKSKEEGVVWTCTLQAKGSGATTILGSF